MRYRHLMVFLSLTNHYFLYIHVIYHRSGSQDSHVLNPSHIVKHLILKQSDFNYDQTLYITIFPYLDLVSQTAFHHVFFYYCYLQDTNYYVFILYLVSVNYIFVTFTIIFLCLISYIFTFLTNVTIYSYMSLSHHIIPTSKCSNKCSHSLFSL